MKIRIITLLLALTLCLSLLSGCGTDNNSESNTNEAAATENSTSASDNRDDTVLFMTEDGNFCYLPDLSGKEEAKILLPASETTERSLFTLDWGYYPTENTFDSPHYWYSDDGKYIYFVTEGSSTCSPLYVTDTKGENTSLICNDVWLNTITPVKNGLVFLVNTEDTTGDTLYSYFDGKATKLADDVSRIGANKNSNGIYFLRRNSDIESKPMAIFHIPTDGSSAPKMICENVPNYVSIHFGTTRDIVIYPISNNNEMNTYSVLMSENGSEPKVLVDDCGNLITEIYDDTFFYERYTEDYHWSTGGTAAYFDGSKTIDVTRSTFNTSDASPYIIDPKNHTYFFYNGSAENPENTDKNFKVFSTICKGKYIGDIHTCGEYLFEGKFLSDSEFVFKSKDADDNDVLEFFKITPDTPATGTILADDPFALKHATGENALYFMTNTLDDGEYDTEQPATLMRYKDGKCDIVTDDVYLDLTRIYEDGTVLTFKGEERNILLQYKNGEETKIGDNIFAYLRLDDGSLLFVSDKVLYRYKDGEQTRLAENVRRFYSNAGDYGIK
ncbi:MAG: hypothetical protein IJO61_08810 [Oscillospiraceae bacterium]|nr:hypothetical protein [Oscillospiraceae bacterium]